MIIYLFIIKKGRIGLDTNVFKLTFINKSLLNSLIYQDIRN